jgi:hypothetical protein
MLGAVSKWLCPWLCVALLAVTMGRASAEATMVPRSCQSGWNLQSPPSPSQTYATFDGISAVSSTDMWAVGEYFDDDSVARPLAEHWDGETWTVEPVPDGDLLFDVAAVASDDVWAVGQSSSNDEPVLIEHWDGAYWTPSSSPHTGPGASLEAVEAISAEDVWAAGHYSPDGVKTTPLLEHWDGVSWSIAPAPTPVGRQGSFGAVSAISASDVWAVGNAFNRGSNRSETLAEHWDGTAWSIVPTPSHTSGDVLTAIAAPSSAAAWAFGCYLDGLVYRLDAIRWDGSAWAAADVPPAPERFIRSATARGASVIGVGVSEEPSLRPLAVRTKGALVTVIPTLQSGEQSWAQDVVAIPGGSIVLAGSLVYDHITAPLVETSCRQASRTIPVFDRSVSPAARRRPSGLWPLRAPGRSPNPPEYNRPR